MIQYVTQNQVDTSEDLGSLVALYCNEFAAYCHSKACVEDWCNKGMSGLSLGRDTVQIAIYSGHFKISESSQDWLLYYSVWPWYWSYVPVVMGVVTPLWFSQGISKVKVRHYLAIYTWYLSCISCESHNLLYDEPKVSVRSYILT